jgi:ABC-type transporter MlaC component
MAMMHYARKISNLEQRKQFIELIQDSYFRSLAMREFALLLSKQRSEQYRKNIPTKYWRDLSDNQMKRCMQQFKHL